ncbi:MATE family efflux transporter [Celerinatantimonas sp. YJH-8]|uniref:MATE family efflux transporter n=1 Tax=Celerinatantimonas sp. YJH-8 TaxID=3228714 RepID=UPI0038C452BD
MNSFYRHELAQLIRLALPVLVAQLIVIGMGIVDTLMAGQVSATDLAGVALGSGLILPIIFFCQGALMAVTPLVANHFGAKRFRHIRQTIIQSLWLAFILSLIVILIAPLLPLILAAMSDDPRLIHLATQYVHFMVFGIFGNCFYQALRSLNEGMGNTRIIMLIGILGLMANIPLNYIFIHGSFGFPRLGGAGCGLASAIVLSLMAAAMAAYVYLGPRYRSLHLTHIRRRPNPRIIFQMLKLGLPIAGSIFFESSLFAAITILMAPFGADTIAAHQITLNFSSIIFMIPLSIGITLTIRIGHLLGERRLYDARKVGFLGVFVGVIIALFTASATLSFRFNIASLYTDSEAVFSIASHLLFVASLFQISDAIQVILSGALRGYQDTRSVLIITLISYWPVGLGSGCILGFTDWFTPHPLGATGFWLSFLFGLSCSAVLLILRFIWLSHHYQRWNHSRTRALPVNA